MTNDVSVSARVVGLDKLVRSTKPEILRRPMRRFFDRAGIAVRNAAVRRTPVDVGRLRSSMTYRVDDSDLPLWVQIGSNVEYTKPVEFGTGLLSDAPDSKRRRYFPPPAALDVWAKRHGAPNGFVVARAIFFRGGTRPRRMLRDGLTASLGTIQNFVSQAAAEIGNEWESG